jgi:hypothetical protein
VALNANFGTSTLRAMAPTDLLVRKTTIDITVAYFFLKPLDTLPALRACVEKTLATFKHPNNFFNQSSSRDESLFHRRHSFSRRLDDSIFGEEACPRLKKYSQFDHIFLMIT